MTGPAPQFADRRDAGRQLARAVAAMDLENPLVLALPRGGVPVAFELARLLRAPLDLLLVRKIGAPRQSEYGFGAVVDGDNPQIVLNEEIMALIDSPAGYAEAQGRRALAELQIGDTPPVKTAAADAEISTGFGDLTRLFRVPQNTKLARNLALFLVHEYLLRSTNVSLLEMSREYRHIYTMRFPSRA